jgi:hypothetical protein
MSSLAHNCSLLAVAGGVREDEMVALRVEARALYKKLEIVDEDRIERYRDMGE